MGQYASLNICLLFLILQYFCHSENNFCESKERKCFQMGALIPARKGSKGIINKNLSIIGNETLLSRTLRILHEFGEFDSIWVSTDGEEIAKEAIRQGVKVHWRDPQTATDDATTVSVVRDFLIKEKEYKILAVVQCTSPFLKKSFLSEALDIMLQSDTDCVFSVTRSHQLRWSDQNGDFVTPINFNPKKRPRRQDWRGELVENGMFYLVKSKLVLQNQILQNDRCKIVEIKKEYSLDIDTETDLIIAKALLQLKEN